MGEKGTNKTYIRRRKKTLSTNESLAIGFVCLASRSTGIDTQTPDFWNTSARLYSRQSKSQRRKRKAKNFFPPKNERSLYLYVAFTCIMFASAIFPNNFISIQYSVTCRCSCFHSFAFAGLRLGVRAQFACNLLLPVLGHSRKIPTLASVLVCALIRGTCLRFVTQEMHPLSARRV